MKLPLFPSLVLVFAFLTVTARAQTNPEIVPIGPNTYSLTRTAETGFARDTEKLKALALEDAGKYCAKLHKELKVISTSAERPKIPLLGFASAKVTFKALDANDPELSAPAVASLPAAGGVGSLPVAAPPPPPRTATDTLYNDLVKLDDLRKRGILTEDEFQAQKKKLLESSK